MIPRRVMGIEPEYGITCAARRGTRPPLDAEESAQRLFAPVLAAHRSTNTFLENGSRLYLDVGAHPEYATAECDNIDDLLAHDRAGELIFARLAKRANEKLNDDGVPGAIHLLKNNVDSEGHSFGCHENYMVHRRPDYRQRIARLIPFFVTRQIVAGAGSLHRGEDGQVRYEFSQRSHQMWEAISSASTRSRPMINTRDEPHADAELYRRMHVIVGDSNISQATTGLKVAATEALLTLVEEGAILPDLELADPMHAIRITGADLSGRANLELASGGLTDPISVQQRMYEAAMNHLDRKGYLAELDPTRRYLLELWERAITAVEHRDPSPIATEIDWAAKLALLTRYRERTGAKLCDARVARLDLAYHDITEGGLRDRMEESGLLRRVITPERATAAMTDPPRSTRAVLRGRFLSAARQARRDVAVDWSTLRLMEANGNSSVVLNDPLATENAEVEALIEEITA